MRKHIRIPALLISLLLILSLMTGCGSESSGTGEGTYTSISELSGKRIGVQNGSGISG